MHKYSVILKVLFILDDKSDDHLQNDIQNMNHLLSCLAKHQILVIFDNIDSLIETNGAELCSVIEKLHSVCDQSRLLLSTRQEVSKLKSLEKATYDLIQLPLQQGIKLLIEKCPRKIENKEIAELIKSEQNCKNLLEHPFTKYLGGYPIRIVESAEALKDKTLTEYYLQIK